MKTVKLALDKIIPYEKNVKRHSEQQIEKLALNIKKYGFIQPLVIDENNVIIIGHGRYEALKFMGETETDVVVLKGFTEEDIKALRIADNKLNDSPFDYSNLKTEMEFILKKGNIDLESLGFSEIELSELQLKIKNTIEKGEESIRSAGSAVSGGNSDEDEQPYNHDIQGVQQQKTPITFFCSKEQYDKLSPVFITNRKWEHNVEKLVEIVDFYLENNE